MMIIRNDKHRSEKLKYDRGDVVNRSISICGQLHSPSARGQEEVEIEVPISMVEKTYAVSKLSDEIIEEIIETTENGE